MDKKERILSALHSLNVEQLSRDEWTRVGMALKQEGFSVSVWDDWSRPDGRYKDGECSKQWESFHGSNNPVTGGTIIKMAKDHGWEGTCGNGRGKPIDSSCSGGGGGPALPPPARMSSEPPATQMKVFLQTIFKPDDVIGYVTNDVCRSEDGKFHPQKGVYTRTAGELIQRLEKNPDDIGAAIGDWNPEAGAWIRMNPLDGKGVKDENVVAYRFALVESDSISVKEQEVKLRELKLPIATLVLSGGKSVHALVRVDAENADEYRECISFLYSYLAKHGMEIDGANKNPSRMTRLPGVTRNGQVQCLVATNIGCGSWNEWRDSIKDEVISADGNSFQVTYKPLDSIREEEVEWLIFPWIPAGCISIICGDGGIGKTTFWVNLLARLSSGRPTILELDDSGVMNVEGFTREPMKCAFFSSEDSVTKMLRKKLREAGADLSNIITVDPSAANEGFFQEFNFGSPLLTDFIRNIHPAVCVFDPLQAFIPPHINMGSRNDMRNCLEPLNALAEKYGTTFIIICHSNKRKGESGRNRVADSADIWDFSRSVIMCGYTGEQKTRYISHEKSNYAPCTKTVLYTLDDHGRMNFAGRTEKRDREFVAENSGYGGYQRTDVDACKEFILDRLALAGGSILDKELLEMCQAEGYTPNMIKEAKSGLRKDGEIVSKPNGKGEPWSDRLSDRNEYRSNIVPFDERAVGQEGTQVYDLSDDTPVPSNGPAV